MRWVIAVCVLWLGVEAGAASEPNWGTWAEEVRKQHPLAGSIYWPRHTPFFTRWPGNAIGWHGKVQWEEDTDGRLFRPLPPGRGLSLYWPRQRILLLGEVHDNPMHHRVRAWLMENVPRPSKWGAVVFEQVRIDQQSALDQFNALVEGGGGTTDALFRLLEWDKSGWPPASIYKPLFEAVVATRLPIYAGDPPRDRMRAVARGVSSSVAAEERARLRLDEPMPASLAETLNRELVDSHCGALPPEAMGGMAAAQRYRDAHLADVLLSAAQDHGSAILIAGNGHVRSDRGVPWHIRRRQPEAPVMSVLLIEVEEGKTDPKLYLPRDPEGRPAADLLIFTPRAERADPCEKMRKSKR